MLLALEKNFYYIYIYIQTCSNDNNIRNIVKENVDNTNDNDGLDLIIYYNRSNTAQRVMRNNIKRNKLNSTNVIYKYNCLHEDCKLRNTNYIGSTKVCETLSKVYLSELLERISTGEVREAAGSLSICDNFSLLICNGV